MSNTEPIEQLERAVAQIKQQLENGIVHTFRTDDLDERLHAVEQHLSRA